MKMPNQNFNILRDLGIIALSIVIAIILAKTGALKSVLIGTQEWDFFGNLLAGIFFVSIFTAAPASVVLFELAASNPVWEVAMFGAIGALIGDLLIFRFIKDSIAEDIRWFIKKTKLGRFFSMFRFKALRWFVPFAGALIVASPLPDEIGLAMMGLSKMKTLLFIPLSFALNFIGILAIALFAKGAP